jgi:hypothetical protein
VILGGIEPIAAQEITLSYRIQPVWGGCIIPSMYFWFLVISAMYLHVPSVCACTVMAQLYGWNASLVIAAEQYSFR